MNLILKRVWNFFQVFIIIYVIFMTVLFLGKNKYGFTEIGSFVFVNVDSRITKNVNDVKKMDLIIIKKDKDFKINDSVYYYSVTDDVYSIGKNPIITFNDNLYTIDNSIVDEDRILGKSGFIIPLIGGFLSITESKIGFLLFVFLPIFIVFIHQVYEFIIFSKEEEKLLKSKVVDSEII